MAEDTFRHREALYNSVSPTAPGGEALDDTEFVELEEAARWPRGDLGSPDPQEPPNFKRLGELALGLLSDRTRDIRPLGRLVLAEAGQAGCTGFARALDLLAHWMTTRWEDMHPLDLDEDGEFFERMEAMPGQLPVDQMRLALESGPLFPIPGLGPATVRTFRIAQGKTNAREGDVSLPMESLRQVMAQHPAAETALTDAIAALAHARACIDAMDAALAERPDVFNVDDFRSGILAGLARLCDEQREILAPFAGGGGGAAKDDAVIDPPPGGTPPPEGAGAASPPVQRAPMPGPQNREEALALLDATIRYYARHARSSPVPLALIALRDLLEGDFNQWIKETARRGLKGAGLDISGVSDSRLETFVDDDDEARDDPAPGVDVGGLEQAIEGLESTLSALPEERPENDGEDGDATPVALTRAEVAGALEALREAVAALNPPAEDSAPAAGPPVVSDRTEVKTALDQIASFLAREEPSSPAPVYLRGLKGLVDADFERIVKTLMPEGDDARLPFGL